MNKEYERVSKQSGSEEEQVLPHITLDDFINTVRGVGEIKENPDGDATYVFPKGGVISSLFDRKQSEMELSFENVLEIQAAFPDYLEKARGYYEEEMASMDTLGGDESQRDAAIRHLAELTMASSCVENLVPESETPSVEDDDTVSFEGDSNDPQ